MVENRFWVIRNSYLKIALIGNTKGKTLYSPTRSYHSTAVPLVDGDVLGVWPEPFIATSTALVPIQITWLATLLISCRWRTERTRSSDLMRLDSNEGAWYATINIKLSFVAWISHAALVASLALAIFQVLCRWCWVDQPTVRWRATYQYQPEPETTPPPLLPAKYLALNSWNEPAIGYPALPLTLTTIPTMNDGWYDRLDLDKAFGRLWSSAQH